MSAICLFGALCAINSTYNHVISLSESPCPSIFRYILDKGEWHGEVNLENVDLQNDVNLRLEITLYDKLVDVSIH